jgi:CBS domain-containing protein
VHEWMHQPSNESTMYLSILLDADTAAGNAELTQRLLAQVKSAIANNRAFMGHFAKSALEFETPLGLFSQFKTNKQGQLDLKKGGLFPIVHGARVLMCEHNLTASTTHERLMALANTRILSQSFASELVEAFDFMQQLRLHQQLTSLSVEQPINNQIHVDSLSHLQKDLLKDSFKLVDQLKNLLNHHYKLNQLM